MQAIIDVDNAAETVGKNLKLAAKFLIAHRFELPTVNQTDLYFDPLFVFGKTVRPLFH